MRKLKNSQLDRKTTSEFKAAGKSPFVILLDNVRSLNNIGSIFRTADCFLVERIILCGITAKPPHRDIHKTALGSTESVEWEYHEDTLKAISELKDKGYIIVGVEQVENPVLLHQFIPALGNKYVLIFGHEVRGVSQEVINTCDLCIEIPQFGTKHSFNISVSAGIVLWELFKKISLK